LPSCVADRRPITDAGDVQSKQVQYSHYSKNWRLLIFRARKLLIRLTDPLDDQAARQPTFDGCWRKFQNTSHNHMKMLPLWCLVAHIAPEGQQTYAFQ
jgi:hypothetical protein